ncbi:hypothetical protein [Halovivax sp.]|uniref:hypothetical protein n=1 Tax=Halovivax sp. TaxID=1935978 RepID=UPI0025BEBFC2|nr:hypothetical protein [Halovivax sp.]
MATNWTDPYRVGIAVGIGLAMVGVGAYLASEEPHFTALIPAFLGVLCVFLGRLGLASDRDRLATYGLGLLALAGAGGSMRALGDIATLLTGGNVDSAVATGAQGLTILLSLVLLVAVAVAILNERR